MDDRARRYACDWAQTQLSLPQQRPQDEAQSHAPGAGPTVDWGEGVMWLFFRGLRYELRSLPGLRAATQGTTIPAGDGCVTRPLVRPQRGELLLL